MPNERIKTKYLGVYFRMQTRLNGAGKERMYYIRYRRGGRDGKQIEEPVGKESEGMTAAKANQIRSLRASGKEQSNTEVRLEKATKKLTDGLPLTIGRLWELYKEANSSRPSLKSDIVRAKNFQHLFKLNPATLQTSDIDRLSRKLFLTQSKRTEKYLSPQTVKHTLGLLKRLLKFGERIGLCPFPQGLHFTMPKLDNEKTENMTAEQLQAYLIALDEEPDQDAAAFLRVALLTGMRKGAIIGLQWKDIDFENGFIILQAEYAKKGKTEKIPIPPALREILLKITKTESPFVFPGKNGGKRQDFRRVARRVKSKAGLPIDFRPLHGLRHTYASHMASSGVSLLTLQKLLTHESPAMTKRYAHLADEALQKAALQADKILQVD